MRIRKLCKNEYRRVKLGIKKESVMNPRFLVQVLTKMLKLLERGGLPGSGDDRKIGYSGNVSGMFRWRYQQM